ncbi:septal ring lytic transglycosylase RlpA family protein [Nonomuraea sp. NPDC004702]
MGQHSHKSSPNDRKLSPGKRRWTAIAAGAAVVAAASTTAWAAVGNDAPGTTAAKDAATATTSTGTPNPPVAANLSQARTATPVPKASSPSASTSTASGPSAKGVPNSPHGANPAPKAPAAARPDATETSASDTASSDTAASDTAASDTATSDTAKKTTKTVKPVKLRATKPKVRVLSSGTCGASYYGDPQMTASGERFNPSAMTAAHKTLPLGSRVRVTNPRNGSAVTVRINDRGPYVGGRCLDLSRAAFDAIGSLGAGVMTVRYEVLAR